MNKIFFVSYKRLLYVIIEIGQKNASGKKARMVNNISRLLF